MRILYGNILAANILYTFQLSKSNLFYSLNAAGEVMARRPSSVFARPDTNFDMLTCCSVAVPVTLECIEAVHFSVSGCGHVKCTKESL